MKIISAILATALSLIGASTATPISEDTTHHKDYKPRIALALFNDQNCTSFDSTMDLTPKRKWHHDSAEWKFENLDPELHPGSYKVIGLPDLKEPIAGSIAFYDYMIQHNTSEGVIRGTTGTIDINAITRWYAQPGDTVEDNMSKCRSWGGENIWPANHIELITYPDCRPGWKLENDDPYNNGDCLCWTAVPPVDLGTYEGERRDCTKGDWQSSRGSSSSGVLGMGPESGVKILTQFHMKIGNPCQHGSTLKLVDLRCTRAIHVAVNTSTMSQPTQNTLHLSEDDIYRTSSQFRWWSFSPEQLAAQRRKTHELALARAKQYLSQQNGAATNGHTNTAECLAENEELRLVQRYGEIIRVTATQLKWPTHIAITAIQYLKRFYLSNSCMTYPPKEIYKTVMFLASKTEAFHLPLSQFSRSVSSEPDTVLAPEYKVMQALRFTLDVRQPSRGLKGTSMELLNMVEGMVGPVPGVEEADGTAIQKRLFQLKAPEDGNKTQWRAKAPEADIKQARDRVQLTFQSAKELLESTASLTDAYLLYTPSQMVMAALEISDAPLLHFYLDTKLPSSSPIRAKILATVHSCAEMLAAYDANNSMSKEERAELEKKLEACRDPNTRDLVKVHAAVKRNGAEEGMVSEQDAKRRKLEREKSNKEMIDLFGPSLPKAKG
ncbi:Cyclin CCL1 [Pseudocercospora fuligena]|uniref:Cyclin CCL1 n=1 Tax=Pseudocercospora fuligena TaxID=685502 RepID=A0A8H6VLN4_9PEZI|nr:Cyclin CCL1 [Pseudocercospora fuligena]